MNKLKSIAVVLVALIASIWLGSEIAQGNVTLAVSVMVFVGVPITLFVVGKGASYPSKVLLLLLLGYAVTGKGFAYLAIKPPFYPGEVVLAIMMVIMLFTIPSKKWKWLPPETGLRVSIIFFIILSAVDLVWYFGEYQMYAIRDSSLGYYMVYFFAGYGAFRNIRSIEVGKSVMAWCFVITIIVKLALILAKEPIGELLSMFTLRGTPIVLWSADGMIFYLSGFLVYAYVRYINTKSIRWAIISLVAIPIAIIGSKTALLLAVICLGIYLALCGRKGFLVSVMISGFIGVLMLSVLAKIAHVEAAEKTFDQMMIDINVFDAKNFEGGTIADTSSTTAWRVAWWGIITRDVMHENPLLGLGYGADLETNFAYEFWELDDSEVRATGNVAGATRYPHNVFFTVLGRLGIIGVLIFMTLVGFICKEMLYFARYARRVGYMDPVEAGMWGAVLGGTVNGFVQATYEVPYVAISYWVILGFLLKIKNTRIQSYIRNDSEHNV